MSGVENIEKMIGKTFVSVTGEKNDEEMKFTAANGEQLKADIEHAERTARLERKYNEVYITVPKWVFDRMKQELDQEGGEDE